jgi:hypothetical protein
MPTLIANLAGVVLLVATSPEQHQQTVGRTTRIRCVNRMPATAVQALDLVARFEGLDHLHGC